MIHQSLFFEFKFEKIYEDENCSDFWSDFGI